MHSAELTCALPPSSTALGRHVTPPLGVGYTITSRSRMLMASRTWQLAVGGWGGGQVGFHCKGCQQHTPRAFLCSRCLPACLCSPYSQLHTLVKSLQPLTLRQKGQLINS